MSDHVESTPAAGDSVLRAITDDGAFRVIAARLPDTARAAIAAQGARGEVAARFAELVAGIVLVRETMAPLFRLQGALIGADGGGRLVVDARPGGDTRGLVTAGAGGRSFDLERGAQFRVTRALPNERVHESVVEVPPGATVSEALMTYMQESEQVVSVVAVGVLRDQAEASAANAATGHVRDVGGYVVQLLPEAKRATLAIMTERLATFPSPETLLRGGTTTVALVAELLHGMPYTRLEESKVRFHCDCSRERVEAALALLGVEELARLAADPGPLVVRCEYCGREVEVERAAVEALFARATASSSNGVH